MNFRISRILQAFAIIDFIAIQIDPALYKVLTKIILTTKSKQMFAVSEFRGLLIFGGWNFTNKTKINKRF